MAYIDGIVVSATDREAYRDYATRAAALFRRLGATRVVDGWGTDVPPGQRTDFHRAVAAREGETIVFGWVEWPDKAARDAGWKRMEDEGLSIEGDPPFDPKRMIFGGFDVIVDG